ncbi:helix-turn-helix domain-containing protein [Granulicatella sp.]
MKYEEWLQLFPNSNILHHIPQDEKGYVIPLEENTYLQIPYDELSSRELALLEKLTKAPTKVSTQLSPWQHYLEQGGQCPVQFDNLQFIHVCLIQKNEDFNEQEWLEMMQEIFGDVLTSFSCFPKHYTIVRKADVETISTQDLQAIHATVEEDFAISMKIFIGNVWKMSEEIPGIYQAEKALFVMYLHESNKQTCLAFAPMVLWGFTQKKLDISPIPETLYTQMVQDEFPDLIEALWQERGTLTKAATRLFIHRNTLQYRIDRFEQLTGLSLKNMDDLTLCHFLLMQQEY